MKQKKNIAANILGGLSFLIYFFLWAPVIVIIVFSFSDNKYGTSWDGFTLKWYAELFNNDAVKDALVRSLVVASITVIVSTIIGIWIPHVIALVSIGRPKNYILSGCGGIRTHDTRCLTKK